MLEIFQPETASAETLVETESPTSPQPLETETSKTDYKANSRLLKRRDFQKAACASPQHLGRSRPDSTSVSVRGEKDKTRSTEPRTKLSRTLGVILSRCSMNCRLVLNSLPQPRRRGIARNGAAAGRQAPSLQLPGRARRDTGAAGLPPSLSELQRGRMPRFTPSGRAEGCGCGPPPCSGTRGAGGGQRRRRSLLTGPALTEGGRADRPRPGSSPPTAPHEGARRKGGGRAGEEGEYLRRCSHRRRAAPLPPAAAACRERGGAGRHGGGEAPETAQQKQQQRRGPRLTPPAALR